VKALAAQLAIMLQDAAARSNLRLLAKLFVFVVFVVMLNTLLFHLLMWREGQDHSFVSGLYWTLVTMSTLGFGDIVFVSDLGRLFSVLVIMTGVTLLLVVLPFAFIQFFYAPWLQAQIRLRAPRELPQDTVDHIVICQFDPVAEELAERLQRRGDPYVVIVSDAQYAAELHREGVSVVAGAFDDPEFHRRIRVDAARLVFANRSDEENTNLALTVREVSASVPIAAVAVREASFDILELSGVTRVLPLKHWLGEQLANRVASSHARSHIVGHYRDLMLAELPLRNTPLAGKSVRATRLRENTGVSIVGVWERGRMRAAAPDILLSDTSVIVVAATQEQLDLLDELLLIYNFNPNPIVVIGAGRVGRAAARALLTKDLKVHVVERDPQKCARLREEMPVFEGDAADYDLLARAGIRETPAVLLTTHDDAMNIYLTSYCRRLNPALRVVSRVEHERNIEAVHRAGADFALSYTNLGAAAVLAEIDQRELTVMGGELDLFSVHVPPNLIGQTLAQSGIGAKTGMLVLAIEEDGRIHTNPPAATVLHSDGSIVMIGDEEQRRRFRSVYNA
jgi:voltage-gated potassium channel